eukprot:m.70761 g.70761  ORF g.70761 m.70761 type:complete len:316 (+) comp35705_c0_seq13:48-995(+)
MPQLLCRVDFLDDSFMTIEVPKKEKGSWLLEYVFKALNLGETDYFGLQFADSKSQLRFLDADKPVKKQLKNGHQTFRFVAKLYPSGPGDLVEDLTRYLFCLQIKRDMSNGRLPCPFETAALFGSLAVQAELGDYDEEVHLDGYLSEFQFLANQPEELIRRAQELHKTHIGLTPADADKKFLERACKLDLYGVHLFPVKDYDGRHVHVGISWAGLAVYGGFFPYLTRLRALPWYLLSCRMLSFISGVSGNDLIGVGEKWLNWCMTTKNYLSKTCWVKLSGFFGVNIVVDVKFYGKHVQSTILFSGEWLQPIPRPPL